MLGTRERTLLLDNLRPPAGYRLRRAVGTSFTLDLMALLTAPLAFTFFDAHDDEGAPVADPVALLEALRRHAEKITLFCQAGAVEVPAADQRLLAFIEGSVVEVRTRHEEGTFHPKVWVLAFEADGKPAIYRVLCLSRNLSFARAWDTCLRLEGAVVEKRQGRFARNEPLADLLLALPGRSVRPVAADVKQVLGRMAEEIRRVDFVLPRPFTDFRVHNFGLGNGHDWPFPQGKRSLAVSPFLAHSTIHRLMRDHGLDILVSRPEAFEDILRGGNRREALPRKLLVLSPGADLDARDAEEGRDQETRAQDDQPKPPAEDETELTGLHAKLYLVESGRDARLFTGSANATRAAFHKNVEVLVELFGRTEDCGIDALLGSDDDPRLDSVRSLLQPYHPPEEIPPVSEKERVMEDLERRAVRLARTFGTTPLAATVRGAAVGDGWDVTLTGNLPAVSFDAEVEVWPSTLRRETAIRVGGPGVERSQPSAQCERPDVIATFVGLSMEALTAFFAFEVTVREKSHTARKRFAATAELVGAPEDRKSQLLRSLLGDRERVLQLLFLILMGEGADLSGFVKRWGRNRGGNGPAAGWDVALLERLLGTLSRDPRRIDDAARLIDDLKKTPEGRALLPDGLAEIWDPVWAARRALDS